MPRCSYCGRENEDTRATCHECGTELSVTPPAPLPGPMRRNLWAALLVLGVGFVLCIASVESHPVSFDGVEVTGTRDFKHHVVAALTLLKTKCPQAYEIVTNYIGVIAQSR